MTRKEVWELEARLESGELEVKDLPEDVYWAWQNALHHWGREMPGDDELFSPCCEGCGRPLDE
jgi:hypothetical protein